MEESNELIEKIRGSMRRSNQSFDSEIEDNIDACLLDMSRVGVDIEKESKLRDKACELYCKWQFGYNDKPDAFKKDYEELRNAMSLSDQYKTEVGVDEG